MIIDANKPFIKNNLALKISFLALICFTLIATPAISTTLLDTNYIDFTNDTIGQTTAANCTVEITKPAVGIGYLFDEFEFPLLLIALPVVIGGITCKAQINVTNEQPDYILWKFANFKGDEFWSFPIDYQPGVTKYEYYMGKINFGQFKIWIYCYDINSNILCEDTIGCLKLF